MEQKFACLRTVEDVSILNGTAFEAYLADVFGDLGYDVDLTPVSGDFGADLILFKDGEKIVVQAKQYAKPVGFDAIKEVHFARSYYSASQAWVVATHGFTPQAAQAAERSDVRLITGQELLSLASQTELDVSDTSPNCSLDDEPFDRHLLDASILVVNNANALPVFLQSELHINPEEASHLIKRMDSLGITIKDPDGHRRAVSKEKFVDIVDANYDASQNLPRFTCRDCAFEVFRGKRSGSITVVESPTTYPTFYSFEVYPGTFADINSRWACVGIDAVEDTSDRTDLKHRLERVSHLKLYNVLQSPDVAETRVAHHGLTHIAQLDFDSIRMALDDIRSGKERVKRPGYGERQQRKLERQEAEECERINELIATNLAKAKQETSKARMRTFLLTLPAIVLFLLLLSTCS